MRGGSDVVVPVPAEGGLGEAMKLGELTAEFCPVADSGGPGFDVFEDEVRLGVAVYGGYDFGNARGSGGGELVEGFGLRREGVEKSGRVCL